MIRSPSPWFEYPTYSWQNKTVTVIGAGIAGCQIAWHLANRGWSVTVIERQTEVAQEASGNLVGIISPKVTATSSQGETFYLQCYRYTLEQFKQLKVNWNPVGVLQLAYKERERKRWEKLQRRNFSKQLLQCVNAQTASRIANIAIPYPAVYFPKAGWVEPRSFCTALLAHKNISLITQTEALSINHTSLLWEVSSKNNQIINSSEALVICSGKDMNLAPVQSLPSISIAGQTTLATVHENDKNVPHTVIDHEGYLTPVINLKKQILFGATYDLNISDSSLSSQANKKNFEQLNKHLPELSRQLRMIKSGHAAIRKVSPDRLPYLGAVPDLAAYLNDYADLHHGKHWKQYKKASYYPSLFISAAYGSRGLTTSGFCAKTLACIINNETAPVSHDLLASLHPARFFIRQLKKAN